jgi:flagellar basal body-associated protein FliL
VKMAMDNEKKEQKREAFITILIGLLIVVVFSGIPIGTLYTVKTVRSQQWQTEKQCYKELVVEYRKADQKQAGWIGKILQAENSAFGETHYCRTLELIRQ